MTLRLLAISVLSLVGFVSCQDKSTTQIFETEHVSAIRPLSADEKAADFDQLLQIFKTYYAPYNYKESRLGISIEALAKDLKAQSMTAKTDEEFMGYLMQFGAALQDGHVQFTIENSASNVRRYFIPIALDYIEGKGIIGSIDKQLAEFTGLAVGDEVISIDGTHPVDLGKIARKYRSLATERSNVHAIIYALNRPSYMTDLVPKKPLALVQAMKKDGSILSFDIPWTEDKYNMGVESVVRSVLDFSVPFAQDYNSVMKDNEANRNQMGSVNPIFLTPESQAKYGFVKVFPSAASMIKFGLKGDEKPGIYAALYRFNGKTILLMRSPTYSPTDYTGQVYLKTYMALLSEYENLADTLVLDQTHNPGGSFCATFYEIFAKNGDVQGVEKARADRKWINDLFINWPGQIGPNDNPWDAKLSQAWGSLVEKAYDKGDFLSEPFPLFSSGSPYTVKMAYTWEKPMIVLIDELAGSCGDIFPMLVKANKRAPLFGQQTMGLGGNVEEVGRLNNSRVIVKLTRGLFFPFKPDGSTTEADYIENNGVLPDIEYNHTVSDFRNGYVDYIKQFSEKAIEQIK